MRPVLGSSLRIGPVVSDSALARAVSEHTDTSKNTKVALKRLTKSEMCSGGWCCNPPPQGRKIQKKNA